jgi:Tfp pilus assembly protein PilX
MKKFSTGAAVRRPWRSRAQGGIALITALLVLLGVSMLALGIARIAFDAERGARAERDRQMALQAAEAGLLDAERDIEGGANPLSARAAMFGRDAGAGFVAGCGRDAVNLGLCAFVPGAVPAWQLAEADAATPYGTYTGAIFPAGGPLPLSPPRYLIELLPSVRAGEDAGKARQAVFRITVFGYGARPGTLVVLQSVYRGAGSGAGQT